MGQRVNDCSGGREGLKVEEDPPHPNHQLGDIGKLNEHRRLDGDVALACDLDFHLLPARQEEAELGLRELDVVVVDQHPGIQ